MAPRYTEAQAREAISASQSSAEALRRLGMCDRGGSWKVLKKWVAIWGIPVDHFDPYACTAALGRTRATPLDEILVAGRPFKSAHLKERLYREGLKDRVCELCGQGELWQGRRMSLILDHINGVRDDNRLENLRVVCPNCNATLDTHCGGNAALPPRACAGCGAEYRAKRREQRCCSGRCAARSIQLGKPNLAARGVERPPCAQLRAEVAQLGWEGTGRKYGVSGNAVRKWMRFYERTEAA